MGKDGKNVKHILYKEGELMEPTSNLDEELKQVLVNLPDNDEKTLRAGFDVTSAWGTTKDIATFAEYIGINGGTTPVQPEITRVDELINTVLSYVPVQPDTYHKPKHIRKKPAKNDKFIKIGGELLDPANTILEIEDILTDTNTVISKGSQIIFNISDIVPILPVQVLSAKVGDIASVSIKQDNRWVYSTLVLKDSTLIEAILTLHSEYPDVLIIKVYRNTDFKDKTVIKRTVKRYSCGHLVDVNTGHDVLPEDLDNHYIEFQDVPHTFEFEAIKQHYNLPELKDISDNIMKELELWLDHPINVAVREWVMLLGESGSGKTSAAFAYAKKKKLDVIKMPGSMQVSVEDLLGYKSVTTGEYIPSLLRDAVENGKLFIFDEIDACNPNTLLCLNGLKDDYFYFPDGEVKVHENFRFIATANTLEHSEKFSARAPLDAATQKRFKIIKYNLHEADLAVRYGLKYMKQIKKERGEDARDLERKIRELKIKELLEKEG